MASHSSKPHTIILPPCIAQHFRDQFRIARASAFRDAEGFQEILFVIERLGFMLANNPKALTLDKYKLKIQKPTLSRCKLRKNYLPSTDYVATGQSTLQGRFLDGNGPC